MEVPPETCLTLVADAKFGQHMQEPGGNLPPGIPRLLDESEMKFQRLPPPPIFGVELFDGAVAETIRRLLLPEIQDGGR